MLYVLIQTTCLAYYIVWFVLHCIFVIAQVIFKLLVFAGGQFQDSQQPVMPRTSIYLKTPVGRQPWELCARQIQLDKKMGEGAFGEVTVNAFFRSNIKNNFNK